MTEPTTSMAAERLRQLGTQLAAGKPIDRSEMAAALVELVESHEAMVYEVEATLSGAKTRLEEGNSAAALHLLQGWQQAPPLLPSPRVDSQHMQSALALGERLQSGEEVQPKQVGDFMARVIKDGGGDYEFAIKTLVATQYLLKKGLHEEAAETIDSWLTIQQRPLSIVGIEEHTPTEVANNTSGMSPGRR